MRDWAHLTIAAAMFSAGLMAGWLAYLLLAGRPAPAFARLDLAPAAGPRVPPLPPPPPPPPPAAPGLDEPALPISPTVTASRGHCRLAWMPPGYVQPMSPAQTAELAHTIGAWIRGGRPASEPAIVYARGLVFAKSEGDPGDDPPYPVSEAPEGLRVCGLPSTWAREVLQDGLARAELTCCDNVCRFGGRAEGDPTDWLVFRPVANDELDRRWALDAWVEVTATGVPAETVAANYRSVCGALARLRAGACPGEPPGNY